MIKKEFFYASAAGGVPVHAVEWFPDSKPQAVLQIAHGIAEHILRYEALAAYLTDRGFAVAGNDHLGHGLSGPEIRLSFGSEGSWDRVTEDMETLRRRMKKKFPDTPQFLLGHSMGSFLARTYLIRFPGVIDGCILTGTGQPAAALIAAGRFIAMEECFRQGADQPSYLLNALAFGAYNAPFAPNRTTHDWLSVNEQNVDCFLASPLCGGIPTGGLIRELLRGLQFIGKPGNLKRMDLSTPVLFLSGEDDPVGEMGKGVRRVFRMFSRVGMRDLSVRLYEKERHEILNESNREEVFRDLLLWMKARISNERQNI